jgi:hypothetical protein
MRHNRLVSLSLAAILLVLVGAGSTRTEAETFDHHHTLLDQVLQKYVAAGRVNYRALKDNPAGLNRYLETLAAIDPRDYEHWTREQKLALWINAYNAYTIKAIIDHYPIQPSWLADPLGDYPPDSIRQIPGVWDRMTWRVMGHDYTLDYMEHHILRKQLAEPRVHFVLVCASLGCPLLENHAFDASGIDKRLDQAAINYIYRDHKVQIDRENRIVRLPRIFEWFAEDFPVRADAPAIFRDAPRATGYVKHSELTGKDKPAGMMLVSKDVAGPLSWIYHYANEQDRAFLASMNYRVVYLYYDWGLNEQR